MRKRTVRPAFLLVSVHMKQIHALNNQPEKYSNCMW